MPAPFRASGLAAATFWVAACSGSAFAGDAAERPTEIRPPFTLTWGETSDRLERMVALAGGRVVNRRMARGNKEAIEVENLPQEGLHKTIFYFKLGSLVGAELLYRSESWTEELYNQKMTDLRRLISKTYGEGEPIVRSTEKVGSIGVTQTLTGYRWTVGATHMMLLYFAATDTHHAFRTISVHYNAN
jgi:hypothetical protein